MYSDLLTTRDVVSAAIDSYKGKLVLPYTTKTLVYRPAHATESTPASPECTVIIMGLGYSERAMSRATKAADIAIQIVVESRYNKDDELPQYITLTEQLTTVCSELAGWTENRASIDEHGMPYQLHNIREQSIYQGIFDAVYQIQRPRKHTISEGA